MNGPNALEILLEMDYKRFPLIHVILLPGGVSLDGVDTGFVFDLQ